MSHEKRGESNEWYTPKYIFDALSCVFDIDVASPEDKNYCHVPAKEFITEDSLSREWRGFVWMNPPYGNQNDKILWLDKFINHSNGISLMPDRTSAPWWHYAINRVDTCLFVKGKIKFIKPDGSIGITPGNGTCLFGIGEKAENALKEAESKGLGKLWIINESRI